MPDFLHHFEFALAALKNERRYRVFAPLERDASRFPRALWRREEGGAVEKREVVVWCPNDYLGMGRHPEVIAAMQNAAARYGVGAGGTRNISGNSGPLVDLEAELADLHAKQAALVFTSGWISNLAAISALFSPSRRAIEIKQIRDARSSKSIEPCLWLGVASTQNSSGQSLYEIE